MKFIFKQMLKVSAFYLEKQKILFLKKYFFGRSQYQNKKALFTDPIFREGFDCELHIARVRKQRLLKRASVRAALLLTFCYKKTLVYAQVV